MKQATSCVVLLLTLQILGVMNCEELLRGQCARRTIVEVKLSPQRSFIEWVTEFIICASDDTLSRWSRLQLESLASIPYPRRDDVRQAAGRKNGLPNVVNTTW
jgi:hypothetical protein